MILYRLVCVHDHEFEVWFKHSAAYDKQIARGAITCPVCGSTEVGKALMAPKVVTTRATAAKPVPAANPVDRHMASMVALMRTVRKELESGSEYVGPRFAEEARKIHFEEAEARSIHGEATSEEIIELNEDGIEVLALPRLPEDLN